MSFPQPSDSFAWTQEAWGAALRCMPLQALAPHLFTSAAVSVSRHGEDPALAAVAASLGLTAGAIVQVQQVHGREVAIARNGDTHLFAGSREEVSVPISPADAIVSDDPRLGVGVRVADCAPVLMADPTGRAVAAVHAGWRGTAAGVVAAAAGAMQRVLGIAASDLIVAIGPSIGACCYEVGPELRARFAASGHAPADLDRWFTKGRGDRWQLDVPRANRDQLEALGVPPDRIFESGLCTVCHAGVFHSYRRSGAAAGRMLGVIRVGDRRPGFGSQG